MFWLIIWILLGWLSIMYMSWVSTNIEKSRLLPEKIDVFDIFCIMAGMILWPIVLILTSMVHIQGRNRE